MALNSYKAALVRIYVKLVFLSLRKPAHTPLTYFASAKAEKKGALHSPFHPPSFPTPSSTQPICDDQAHERKQHHMKQKICMIKHQNAEGGLVGLGANIPHVIKGGGLVYEVSATTNTTVGGLAAQQSIMTTAILDGETSISVRNFCTASDLRRYEDNKKSCCKA